MGVSAAADRSNGGDELDSVREDGDEMEKGSEAGNATEKKTRAMLEAVEHTRYAVLYDRYVSRHLAAVSQLTAAPARLVWHSVSDDATHDEVVRVPRARCA